MELQSFKFPSWFPFLIPELQVSDWMDLRRDFELKTCNIVDTAIKYGVFGSYTEYTFYYVMAIYGPIESHD